MSQCFTLIATVRNEAATIAAFVDSLLAQTRPAEEIVIVDGASSDGTREILEAYAARGALRLISEPCNIAEGRNLGIAAATGSHLAVTDAGCKVDPDWLAEIARAFAQSPPPDVVAGNFRFDTHTAFEQSVVLATFQPDREQSETARFFPSSRSVAFTKAAWEKAGGYPDWLYAAEDTLFNIRLRQLGLRFVFARDAIVRWRPRESWRALAKQRLNFSLGNARVGIGEAGYRANLRTHGLFVVLLAAGVLMPAAWLGALLLGVWHARQRLLPQALRAAREHGAPMGLRVLAVMEFVRLVHLWGYVRGRLDRLLDPRYVARQRAYMGVDSVEALEPGYRRQPYAQHTPVVVASSVLALAGLVAAWGLAGEARWAGLVPALVVAGVGTLVLLIKSLANFSQTGPNIREEILVHYRRYTVFAVVRLALWAFVIMSVLALVGVGVHYLVVTAFDAKWSVDFALLAAALGVLVGFHFAFVHALRYNPGLLVASMSYRNSRFYTLWRFTSPLALRVWRVAWTLGFAALVLAAGRALIDAAAWHALGAVLAACTAVLAGGLAIAWEPEARARRAPERAATRPNIVMIGSDTLRADRLGSVGYRRALTPNIDALAAQGAHFAHCYVPCARTAPSLVSMFTGTWPHRHGIRDNFVALDDAHLNLATLPGQLNAAGYRSAAISDWCGADLGKFPLGFDHLDLPEDQWNLKYLIRQGPKDLRLFLSLFTRNRFGRRFLPEIYYLGGVPQTRAMGKRARRLLTALAQRDAPFLLNLFYSTTHPPFASEWPWYTRYADPAYTGESKFAMARLTDPFEIIRRQGAPREEFDLDQIIDLYDGSVAQFDDEVGKTLALLEASGLADSTIVVVYSDHGMEFFEHDTWGQGNSAVGEASPRIPLVIRDPRLPARGRLDAVTRSIDLAPTLLERVGLTIPESMQGVSLAAYLAGRADAPELDAFNETGIWIADIPGLHTDHLRYPNLLDLIEIPDRSSGTLALKPAYVGHILRAKDRMLRRGHWKLVYQPLRDGYQLLLFDLLTDPGCRTPVDANHPEACARLWAAMQDFLEEPPSATGPVRAAARGQPDQPR